MKCNYCFNVYIKNDDTKSFSKHLKKKHIIDIFNITKIHRVKFHENVLIALNRESQKKFA